MDTFAPARELVDDPGYETVRQQALAGLELSDVDPQIADLISAFTKLPHCFTLQCCHGHFLCRPEDDPETHDPIPDDHDGPVRYRIAYVAVCIEASARGRALRDKLAAVTRLAPEYVQFGSPTWFWARRVNSYALQVEPAAHQLHDQATLEPAEARRTAEVRDRFFDALRNLVAAEARA